MAAGPEHVLYAQAFDGNKSDPLLAAPLRRAMTASNTRPKMAASYATASSIR